LIVSNIYVRDSNPFCRFFVATVCLATFGIMAVAPCCDNCGRNGGHTGVIFAGAFCLFLSLCMLFLTCIIITARGGPAHVVILGLCAFASAAETMVYAAYTGRRQLAWSFFDVAESALPVYSS
jgi:hypothetical protein